MKCPRCQGELREVTSRVGIKFYGCCQYPECRYTESIKDQGQPAKALAAKDKPIQERGMEQLSRAMTAKAGEKVTCSLYKGEIVIHTDVRDFNMLCILETMARNLKMTPEWMGPGVRFCLTVGTIDGIRRPEDGKDGKGNG